MKKISINWLRLKVRQDEYEFSSHADREREADKISILEVEEAVLRGEIIEDYPDDPRGPSCLVLGYGDEGYPIHIVCGKTASGKMRIVTVYIPSLPKWIGERTRRNKNV